MNEFSLSNSLCKAVLKLCNEAGFDKIHRILVKIGGMRKVNPELMTFVFAGLTINTPAEGAILSIMLMPVTIQCMSCRRMGVLEDVNNLECPSCGSRNIHVLSGFELTIEALEVEKDFDKK